MLRFLSLTALLAPVQPAAPAAEYLRIVETHLSRYNGPSTVNAEQLAATARMDLERRCAENPDCPADVGREVARTLVAGYADRHTNLKDPHIARRARAEMKGETVQRVGLRLMPLGKNVTAVGYVRPGSPADAAGLRVGQVVQRVAGGAPTVSALVAAEERGEVPLVVDDRDLTLHAVPLPARDMPVLKEAGAVNVVNIPTFLGQGVASSFFETLRTLDPAVPLVVDVRANGGGSVVECTLAASAFARARHELHGPRGVTVYVAESGQLSVNDRERADIGTVTAAPVQRVAVLVGPRTASCGEVFAGALQQAGATIVGERTAGVRNSAISMFDLPDGSLLSVTTSKAFSSGGVLMDGSVIPNVPVTPAAAGGRDQALEAARAALGVPGGAAAVRPPRGAVLDFVVR